MKLRKLALALTTAVLLPTSAYAGDNTDAVIASFDRAFNRGIVVQADPVLASFERDLYREPSAIAVASVSGEPDPVNEIINVALRCNKTVTAIADSKHNPNTCSSV